MGEKVYRVTSDPKWLEKTLHKAEHLIVKGKDGSLYCRTHRGDPNRCAERNQDDIVWRNSLDGGKYVVTVVLAPYRGQLTLSRDGSAVLALEVGLSYDAPFGPDVEDVREWSRLCERAADADYNARGETPPTGPDHL